MSTTKEIRTAIKKGKVAIANRTLFFHVALSKSDVDKLYNRNTQDVGALSDLLVCAEELIELKEWISQKAEVTNMSEPRELSEKEIRWLAEVKGNELVVRAKENIDVIIGEESLDRVLGWNECRDAQILLLKEQLPKIVRRAIYQGYGTKRNAHKEVDVDLMEDMSIAVLAAIEGK